MIRIVQATPADLETVLALVGALLRELEERPDEFRGIDRARILRDLMTTDGRFTAFLARTTTDEAVGVVTVMETFAIYAGGNYGVIDEMYVAPAHRSRGIGRLLIDTVKDHGRRKGWIRIEVTAPPEPGWERTLRFYEARGFVFTGPKLRFRIT